MTHTEKQHINIARKIRRKDKISFSQQVAMNYRAMRMMGLPDAAVDRPALLHRESDGAKNDREPACGNVDW